MNEITETAVVPSTEWLCTFAADLSKEPCWVPRTFNPDKPIAEFVSMRDSIGHFCLEVAFEKLSASGYHVAEIDRAIAHMIETGLIEHDGIAGRIDFCSEALHSFRARSEFRSLAGSDVIQHGGKSVVKTEIPVTVDIGTNTLTVSGQKFKVKLHQALIVAKLLHAAETEVGCVTGDELREMPACHGKHISREISELKESFPLLAPYVKAVKGKGGGFYMEVP